MTNSVKVLLTTLLLIICLSFSACGGSGSSSPSGAGGGSTEGDSFSPEFHDAEYHETDAEGNGEIQVDFSCVSDGYFGSLVNSDARIKLQVLKDADTYTYDVIQGTPQLFPLQCGDGEYTIRFMKNVEANSYYELYSTNVSVSLNDPMAPYLRPNAYADFSESSDCVQEAARMAAEAESESEFVDQVYDYICRNVEYDYDEAKTVKSGYVPDPDEVMNTGKGICFDYASLAASMLRSQGIPTKIIFGYVAPDNLYHAWNMFYTEEKGWTTVEISVDPGDWSRVDLTFSDNGQSSKFIGDGSNYQDVYEF